MAKPCLCLVMFRDGLLFSPRSPKLSQVQRKEEKGRGERAQYAMYTEEFGGEVSACQDAVSGWKETGRSRAGHPESRLLRH